MRKEKASYNEPKLSSNPTVRELFDFIQVDEGIRVLPVTVSDKPSDTRLLIAIQGEASAANIVMAQLMSQIDNLHDLAEQREAADSDNKDAEIVVP